MPGQVKLQWALRLIACVLAGLTAGCAGGGEPGGGSIHIDGSSTVYPITESVVEAFQAQYPGIRVEVGISGTGGGFQKFCAGEAEVADASRPIKPIELERCHSNGVEPKGFHIALDGLSVVVSPENDFASCLAVDELKRIWEAGSTVERWSQVRPEWPDQQIELFGPGVDSGTFDYFTATIIGAEGASRADFAASEDYNVLVHGVSGHRGALGYFGHAYYAESPDLLKLVAVDAGEGCVFPTRETIASGEYRPLTRPLYLYVDVNTLDHQDVVTFMRYYLENAPRLVPEAGYVPVAPEVYEAALGEIG